MENHALGDVRFLRRMTTRPATRGLTARPQNENLARPPLPGRSTSGTGVTVDPAKMLTLKRKAEGVAEGSKAPKKRSALGEITNVSNGGCGGGSRQMTVIVLIFHLYSCHMFYTCILFYFASFVLLNSPK